MEKLGTDREDAEVQRVELLQQAKGKEADNERESQKLKSAEDDLKHLRDSQFTLDKQLKEATDACR